MSMPYAMESTFVASTPSVYTWMTVKGAKCGTASRSAQAPRRRTGRAHLPAMCVEETVAGTPEAYPKHSSSDSSADNSMELKPVIPEKKKAKLQQLLSKYGVSSSDTCALLIRSGQVRVNGTVVKEVNAKVRMDSEIEVSGRLVGEAPDDAVGLPRAQRDFQQRELFKDYDRKVDGGFFARKGGRKRR